MAIAKFPLHCAIPDNPYMRQCAEKAHYNFGPFLVI